MKECLYRLVTQQESTVLCVATVLSSRHACKQRTEEPCRVNPLCKLCIFVRKLEMSCWGASTHVAVFPSWTDGSALILAP
jgi:hypothetical protein